MPYTPHVQDRRGEIRAAGSGALNDSIIQGLQQFGQNQSMIRTNASKVRAAIAANPELNTLLTQAMTGPEETPTATPGGIGSGMGAGGPGGGAPAKAPSISGDVLKAFGKIKKGNASLSDTAVAAAYVDTYGEQKRQAMAMQQQAMQIQQARMQQEQLQRLQQAAGKFGPNPMMAQAAQIAAATGRAPTAEDLARFTQQGSQYPVMSVGDMQKQFPQAQYDATMVPTGAPGMVQVRSVSPRAPAVEKNTPVPVGDQVLVFNPEGKVVGREAVSPALPAGYQRNPKGGIEPIPGSGAEKEAAIMAGKETANILSRTTQLDVMANAVAEVLPKVDFKTAGPIGGVLLAAVPGTDAYDLAAKLDTLKANIGFQQLAQMRAASPTGGALGQVAVRELDFLQSALGNLNPAQSPKQLKENLEKIQAHLANWRKTLEGVNPDEPKAKAEGAKLPQQKVGRFIVEEVK